MVALALELGATRVEIAHVQYYGWALKNRGALMPTAEQVERAIGVVEDLRKRHHGHIVIDAVVPDYYARYPKPCVGGWGRRSLNVTPSGVVLPCHAAQSIPDLEFWNVLIIPSPISGRTLPPSTNSAATTGCRSRAEAARASARISAAAAARPTRSPATRAQPTRCAISRRSMRLSASSPPCRWTSLRLPALTPRRRPNPCCLWTTDSLLAIGDIGTRAPGDCRAGV